MTEPFVNKGKAVFRNPSIPGDTAAVMHPSLIVPDDERVKVNGEPVIESSHEFVVKKDKNVAD